MHSRIRCIATEKIERDQEMRGGERSPVASRDGTEMKRSESLAMSRCAVQRGNRRRHAEPTGVVPVSQAIFTFRRLFRAGETGALNASCCSRSSLSEMIGNSSVSTQISPNNCARRADLSCDERRSQWTNVHIVTSTQIQLSTWLTRLSPRDDLARQNSPLAYGGAASIAAYSGRQPEPLIVFSNKSGPYGYASQEGLPTGTKSRPP